MAGRPLEAMALIGIGAENFSITPAGVGPLKAMIRSLDAAAIRGRMDQLLAKPPKDMRKALTDWARRHRSLSASLRLTPAPQPSNNAYGQARTRNRTDGRRTRSKPSSPTVGERLRVAREEKKLSLEDVAAQTRIPQRHLASIETADWDSLPAPTYTIGFAKSYASAGRARPHRDRRPAARGDGRPALRLDRRRDVFEPADPARTMPKWLVLGAIVAVDRARSR